MLKNKLFLFTADFPYGTGETFLETEITYLAEGFDEVVIVSQNIHDEQTRQVPDNCTFSRIDLSVSNTDKLKSLVGLSDPLFWKEKSIVKKVYAKKLSKGIVSTMLISLWRAKKVKQYISQICEMQTSDSQVFIYSYWCDDVALGLSLAQKENKEIRTFCRIHRWDVYFEESAVNYLPYRHFITKNISQIFSISQDGIDYALKTWKVTQKEKFSLSRLGIKNTYGFQISNNDPFLIVSCSNLIPVKRVHLIAEALKEIRDVQIKWVHIGDGPERKKLEALILNLPSNIKVDLLGRIPNSAIYTFYAEKRPDLFINVSSSEGVPVSIMEAMSFGIPVIATDVGGNREIVNKENGRLVPTKIAVPKIADHFRDLILLNPKDKNVLNENAFETWQLLYNADKNYYSFTSKIQEIK
ncbi:MAG: hypothetical protein RI883_1851 [Bacteroidota bacterium]|jgi:glycosyltransferase involved in cell wall biosynthesis